MWVLPTYNRPAQCSALIEQMKNTGISTPGILFVNGCEMRAEYEKISLPDQWDFFWQEENIGCNAPLNKILDLYPNEKWYGCINDDEWVYSSDWDNNLVSAASNWYVANANDGWQSAKRIHSFVVIGGSLVRTLGWWSLPGLWHWYGEEVYEILADNCGLRRFCHQIKSEHRHWMNGLTQKDSTYISGEKNRDNDQLIFRKWLAEEASATIEKIKKEMLKECC